MVRWTPATSRWRILLFTLGRLAYPRESKFSFKWPSDLYTAFIKIAKLCVFTLNKSMPNKSTPSCLIRIPQRIPPNASRWGGGGRDRSYLRAKLTNSGRGETTIGSSQRVFLTGILKIAFKISQVSSRSGQRSKLSLFALSVTMTGIITAANPSIAKAITKRWRKCHVLVRLTLSKFLRQVQVK